MKTLPQRIPDTPELEKLIARYGGERVAEAMKLQDWMTADEIYRVLASAPE